MPCEQVRKTNEDVECRREDLGTVFSYEVLCCLNVRGSVVQSPVLKSFAGVVPMDIAKYMSYASTAVISFAKEF